MRPRRWWVVNISLLRDIFLSVLLSTRTQCMPRRSASLRRLLITSPMTLRVSTVRSIVKTDQNGASASEKEFISFFSDTLRYSAHETKIGRKRCVLKSPREPPLFSYAASHQKVLSNVCMLMLIALLLVLHDIPYSLFL